MGFSVRVHDWLASCDYLVSANRQSYVDMVILEALSVGTPIMMTMNAGHEIFRRQSSGIQEILNPYGLELQRLFLDPNLRKREDNYDAVRANKNLHVNSYTPADCARRLEDIACSLL